MLFRIRPGIEPPTMHMICWLLPHSEAMLIRERTDHRFVRSFPLGATFYVYRLYTILHFWCVMAKTNRCTERPA